MTTIQELDSLLDDLEERNGEDEDVYCELSYDFQDILDSIKYLERKLIAALSKRDSKS